jgi:hypothetical protein
MIFKIKLLSALLFVALTVSLAGARMAQAARSPGSGSEVPARHTFGVEGGKFMLDGAPGRTVAGRNAPILNGPVTQH